MITTSALTFIVIVCSCLSPSIASATGAGFPSSNEILIEQHFDSTNLPSGWAAADGSWTVADGVLTGVSRSSSALARMDLGLDADFARIEADVIFTYLVNADPRRWFGFATGMGSVRDESFSVAQMRFGSDASDGVGFVNRRDDGTWEQLEHLSAPTSSPLGQSRHVVIQIAGSKSSWVVDGRPFLSTFDASQTEGNLGLLISGASVSFDNLVVTSIPMSSASAFAEINTTGSDQLAAAHKGLPQEAPESTLASFEAARQLDPEMVEFDVRYTRDGVPVVLHDSLIDRTTNGTGQVSQLDWRQISSLDAGSWFDSRFADQHVPTLAEVAGVFSGTGIKLLVDLKTRISLAQAAELSTILNGAADPSSVYFKSYSLPSLKNLRSAAGDMNRVLSMEGYVAPSRSAEQLLADVESVDAIAINVEYWASVGRVDLVSLFHAHGKGVIVWTLDSPCEWVGAESLHADVVTTNDLANFQRWLTDGHRVSSLGVPESGIDAATGILALRAHGMPRSQAATIAIDSPKNSVFFTTSDCWGNFDADIDVGPLSAAASSSHVAYLLDADGTARATFKFEVPAARASSTSTPESPSNPSPIPYETSSPTPAPSSIPTAPPPPTNPPADTQPKLTKPRFPSPRLPFPGPTPRLYPIGASLRSAHIPLWFFKQSRAPSTARQARPHEPIVDSSAGGEMPPKSTITATSTVVSLLIAIGSASAGSIVCAVAIWNLASERNR